MSLLSNHGLIDSGPQVQFVSSGSAVVVTGGATTINVPYPTDLPSGGIMILQIAIGELVAAPTTPTGWSLLYLDTDGTFVRHFLYFKYIVGDETGNLAVTTTAVSNVAIARIYTFKSVANPPPIEESGGFIEGTLTYGPASITSTAPRALAVSFVYLPASYVTGAYTGQTGGTWAENATATTTTGSDATIQLQSALLPNPGTISGGSYAADTGGLSLTRSFALISDL